MRRILILLSAVACFACSSSASMMSSDAATAGNTAATPTFHGQPGTLWILDESNHVFAIDTKDGHVVHQATVSPSRGLAFGGGSVWISYATGLGKIDPATAAVSAPTGLGSTSAIVFGAGAAWYGTNVSGTDELVRFDAAAHTASTFTLPGVFPTLQANRLGLAASAAGLYAFLADSNAPLQVLHVNPAGTSVLGMTSLASLPHAGVNSKIIAMDGKIVVGNPENDQTFSMVTIDPNTHALLKQTTLAIPKDPGADRFPVSGGATLYVCDASLNAVYEIDPDLLTVKRTLPLMQEHGTPNRGPIIAAGGLWTDGGSAVRRLDLTDGSVVDIPLSIDRFIEQMAFQAP